MDDKNGMNKSDSSEEKKPLEIPENTPGGAPEPIKASAAAERQKKVMKKIKTAYALAIILAVAAAFTAKIATEKAVGSLAPSDTDFIITVTPDTTSKDSVYLTEEPEFEVRQNITNVPDTRTEETEKEETTTEKEAISTTEIGKYAVPYEDYFVLPLGTDILKDYSPDTPSYNATMGDWRTHNGVDFKGVEGDQVKAVAYGKVSLIYEDTLYGTVIEIDHGNGVTAKYCGFNGDTVEVKQGSTVEAGDLLGYLGVVPSEKTDLSHLHFEIIYNGKNVDPLELMNK